MKKNKSLAENTGNVRKVLLSCLKEAGSIIGKNFGKTHRVQFKTPISLVTEIDMAAEKKIVSIVQNAFPSHRLLTEESAPKQGTSPYRWIVDPLDGTTNYAHHIPICAVSIGVEHDGKMIMGGIYNPMQNEMFFTELGAGSFLNAKKIRVSNTSRLIDSLLVTGFPYDSPDKAKYYVSFVESMLKKTRGLRRLGAAAIDLAYVACGKFDAFWEFNLQPWDVAAGILMVQESGGKVSGFDGKKMNVDQPAQMLASNAVIHPSILKIFSKVL